MKNTTVADLGFEDVRILHLCAECGMILAILKGGKPISLVSHTAANGRYYCLKCVSRYATQKYLEE